jgi:hypothetical protein
VITVGKLDTCDTFDLGLQAQFHVPIAEESTRVFHTSVIYRAYVNPPSGPHLAGIHPKILCGSPPCYVTIAVPFYTQLKPVDTGDIGTVYDQFIDWWNGGRVLSFDGLPAITGAMITYGNCTAFTTSCPPSQPFPPQKVVPDAMVPPANAKFPSCVNSDGRKCTVSTYAYTIDPRTQSEFQLDEYTFAAAIGGKADPDKRAPQFVDTYDYVGYNISAVDAIYTSTAVGPLNAKPPIVTDCTQVGNACYLGSPLTTDTFLTALKSFSNGGKNWPYYVAPYYKCDDGSIGNPNCKTGTEPDVWPPDLHATCSLAPFTRQAYALPKVPGTFDVIDESYKGIPSSSPPNTAPPSPPVLSSQPPNYLSLPGYKENKCIPPVVLGYDTPNLGKAGQAMVDLWDKCANPATADSSATCQNIAFVDKFFKENYAATCKGTPDTPSILAAVYGVGRDYISAIWRVPGYAAVHRRPTGGDSRLRSR